jgi:tetratricopeptide (TPR) repeat protein
LWSSRTEVGFKKAIEYYQQALARDPNFALAYGGLADSYGLLGAYKIYEARTAFPKAREAAVKALELDDSLAQAHTSLALVTWLHDWDWQGADREFKRAIELDAGYATAPHWYALYLAEMGRFDEAIASAKRALELEPRSPYINSDFGRVLFYARRYDESLKQYRKTIELAPSYTAYYPELCSLYEVMGMTDEWFAIVVFFGISEELKKVYLKGGITAYWQRWLKDNGRTTNKHMHSRAEVCVRLGKFDEAMRNLHMLYETKDHRIVQLKVNPAFDNLRSDPRFQELLQRLNLAP